MVDKCRHPHFFKRGYHNPLIYYSSPCSQLSKSSLLNDFDQLFIELWRVVNHRLHGLKELNQVYYELNSL